MGEVSVSLSAAGDDLAVSRIDRSVRTDSTSVPAHHRDVPTRVPFGSGAEPHTAPPTGSWRVHQHPRPGVWRRSMHLVICTERAGTPRPAAQLAALQSATRGGRRKSRNSWRHTPFHKGPDDHAWRRRQDLRTHPHRGRRQGLPRRGAPASYAGLAPVTRRSGTSIRGGIKVKNRHSDSVIGRPANTHQQATYGAEAAIQRASKLPSICQYGKLRFDPPSFGPARDSPATVAR